MAHVLLECNHYNVVRQKHFNVSSLHELFDTVNAQNILRFIVSRNLTFIRLIDFTADIVFKPIVNT